MEGGNGATGANGQGANGHEPPARPVRYRVSGDDHTSLLFIPRRGGGSRCPCRSRYSYPNSVVLSMDDKRGELLDATRELQEENVVVRDIMANRQERIRELEDRVDVLENRVDTERDRTRATRDQVHRFRARLDRLSDEVHERAARIGADLTTLEDTVADVIAESMLEVGSDEDSSEVEPYEDILMGDDPLEESEPEEEEEDPSEVTLPGGPAED